MGWSTSLCNSTAPTGVTFKSQLVDDSSEPMNTTVIIPLDEGRNTIELGLESWSDTDLSGTTSQAQVIITKIEILGSTDGGAIDCKACPAGLFSQGTQEKCDACPPGFEP